MTVSSPGEAALDAAGRRVVERGREVVVVQRRWRLHQVDLAARVHRTAVRGDHGHLMLGERIASQSEVIRAIVSGYSQCWPSACTLPAQAPARRGQEELVRCTVLRSGAGSKRMPVGGSDSMNISRSPPSLP